MSKRNEYEREKESARYQQRRREKYGDLKSIPYSRGKKKPNYISSLEWVDRIGPERWSKWFDGLSDSQREFIRKHGVVYATYSVWKGLKDNKGWKWDLYVE
jgi:hypothetical protein